jgi:glutamine amidotransferase
MCRLYGFRANQATKVECSLAYAQNALLSQSASDREGVSHPDGWGIASYTDGIPDITKRARAAFRDLYFGMTAERSHARTVVAHVRLATVGETSPENTQPFGHGRWVFAHNGTLRAFDALRAELERETHEDLLARRLGATDSEAAFFWLLSRMRDSGIDEARPSDLEALVPVIGDAIGDLSRRSEAAGEIKPTRLNFILTDGEILLATRWRHSLHWIARLGIRDCEICGIPHVEGPGEGEYHAVAVASEPITQEEWSEVPEGHILAVDRDIDAKLHRI